MKQEMLDGKRHPRDIKVNLAKYLVGRFHSQAAAQTAEDEFNGDKQGENFQKMAEACASIGLRFTWEYDKSGTKHDRDITTDHGWKIVLSRGLDVFQRYELNEAFSFTNRLQQQRQCKEFNVTYVRI
jgi:ATP-dependent Lon protease